MSFLLSIQVTVLKLLQSPGPYTPIVHPHGHLLLNMPNWKLLDCVGLIYILLPFLFILFSLLLAHTDWEHYVICCIAQFDLSRGHISHITENTCVGVQGLESAFKCCVES